MVIILVLVIAWGVILAPGIIRKIRASNSERSISSFHHSLDLLESAAPRVVLPAYRLSGEDAGRIAAPVLVPCAPTTSIQPHPHLVLLRPDGQGGVATMNDRYDSEEREDHGYSYEADHDAYFDDYADTNASYDDYDSSEERYDHGYPADPFARREAALRRRNILFGLVGAVVVTLLGGFVFSMLWYVTVVTVLLLGAYVGLMAWAATRGTITLGASSSSSRSSQRHVARAVIPPYESPADGRWSDMPAAYDERDDSFIDGADDGWWDQPRRVAAR